MTVKNGDLRQITANPANRSAGKWSFLSKSGSYITSNPGTLFVIVDVVERLFSSVVYIYDPTETVKFYDVISEDGERFLIDLADIDEVSSFIASSSE